MKVTAIIQARLGSTRLPGKVLIEILDRPIIEHVVTRVQKAKNIERIILATTSRAEDGRLEELANGLGIQAYRGSEEDVLDRYYQAAKKFNVKHIARISADCPLIDPKVIDDVIRRYFELKVDYCSNTLNDTFPDGEDVEVFSLDALTNAWKNAHLSSEREHVTPYIKKNSSIFKLESFRYKIDLSAKRWTLDRKEDLELIKGIFEALYPVNPNFGMDDILKFLQDNPHLESANKDIVRNEGYLRSLKEDRKI